MQYIEHYKSPFGAMLMAADDAELTGLWFEGQKYFASCLDKQAKEKELPVFSQAKEWLDTYFAGKKPDFELPLRLIGTEFQKEVWQLLCSIPYGKTITYGEISRLIAEKRGVNHISAQAVGGAVGRNKVSIIVPCHRIIGANGSLIGYAGGLDKKSALLQIEGVKL